MSKVSPPKSGVEPIPTGKDAQPSKRALTAAQSRAAVSKEGEITLSGAQLRAYRQKKLGETVENRGPIEPLDLLHEAEPPGVFFDEESTQDGYSETDDEPALAEAVEETIRLLFGVRGIHHVGPGKNDFGQWVVVISTTAGFTDDVLAQIPERVKSFPTLVAIPFDRLPLRKSS